MGRAALLHIVGRSRQNWAHNLMAESEDRSPPPSFPVCSDALANSLPPPQVILSAPHSFLCICLNLSSPSVSLPTCPPGSAPHTQQSPTLSPHCQAAAEPGVEADLCELHRGHGVL